MTKPPRGLRLGIDREAWTIKAVLQLSSYNSFHNKNSLLAPVLVACILCLHTHLADVTVRICQHIQIDQKSPTNSWSSLAPEYVTTYNGNCIVLVLGRILEHQEKPHSPIHCPTWGVGYSHGLLTISRLIFSGLSTYTNKKHRP
jgi:hypothetical protein